jgi:putative nucleotidyltransferase with HDIG domain
MPETAGRKAQGREMLSKIKVEFRDKDLFIKLFGGDVYAVGGYVRDVIRRVPAKEVDLIVTGHPLAEIIKKLSAHGRVGLVGKSFGIIKFTREGKTYDVALPRIDAPKGQGTRSHKDITVAADPDLPIEKDLERRDFRCNSMAARLSDGKIIDPFQGRQDIAAKVLRVTSPRSFPEDPLRVLRAARFASVLHYAVDPSVYGLSKDLDLKGLSVERVTEELFKILLHSPRPSVGLEELFRLGALRQRFPELYKLTLSIQDAKFHPEKDSHGHHTVWQHTKLTVDQAAVLARQAEFDEAKRLCLLLAALYHDVGKPATAEWEHKHGRMVITNIRHDLASEKIARVAFIRLKVFSWNGVDVRKKVLRLIRTHHRAAELWQNRAAVTKKAFNRLAADLEGEIDLLITLDAADRAGRKDRLVDGLDRPAQWLMKKVEEMRISRETIKPLIMGRDLIKLGVAPGPDMGRILKRLYKLQLDNAFDDKAGGLSRAKKIIGRTSS